MNGDVSKEVSVLALVNGLLRHRRIVVIGAFVGLAAGAVSSALDARTHTAATRFVARTGGRTANLGAIAAQLGLSVPVAEQGESPQFFADLVTTRPVLEAVVAAPLRDEAGAMQSLTERWGGSGTADQQRARAVTRLLDRLSAVTAAKTGVITVSARANDATLAASIAARAVAVVDSLNRTTRRSQASAERRFTEQRVDSARRELRTAEGALESFLARNRDIRDAPALLFTNDRLAREVALRQQVYVTLSQAFEQARIDEVRDTPVLTVIEPPIAAGRRGIVAIAQALVAWTLAGAVIATVFVLMRELFAPARTGSADEQAEFAALRAGLRRA